MKTKKVGHIGNIGLIAVAMAASVSAQTGITFVNPGSSPDATDGDTIRNAFIKCNNDFTYIGGQLSTLNNSLAGLGTTYDYNGMALLIGLNATNYVRYAVGTNTVGWLGCLNAESNVLQGDITALTNNVDALWGIVGGDGSGLVMPTVATPAPFPWGPEDAPWGPPTALVDYGSQMCFDSYKVPGQGGPGYGWTTGIRSDGFGTLSAYQFQGNLVDANGAGNWAITDVNQDTVNTPYGGVPPVDITGFIPVSQNNGSWLWTAPSSLTFLHMAFENGAIYSYANAGAIYMVVGGSFQADQLMDSYGDTPASGMVATSVGTDGTWQWQTPPTLPSTLNFDSGSITSDGSGDATCVSIYAQQLKDSSSWTGSAGYYAQANGSGGWAWTEWPYTLSYDGGAVYSDGSGNVTAQTFNPVSDRARKERIVSLAPSNALALALALDDYTWRFKAHTNTVGHVQPASGMEYGPMAQDWHAVTGLGGGTNISMTSMSGLLLGAIQGLSQAQGIFTNATGARFALVVNAQTNGFIFVTLP